jgi:uncharacterized protein involved in copper resistance
MRLSLVLVAVLGLAGSLPVPAAQEQHPGAPVASPQQAPAKHFATDATLRREMQGIRSAVEALGHYEMGHMGAAQAVDFATAIEEHVRTIIANCKLPPDADGALHEIIVPLMQDAGALKQNPQDLSAVPRLRNALDSYDRQFYDP